MKLKIVYKSGGRREYFIDGQPATKKQVDKAFPPKPIGAVGGHLPSCWPLASDALAVHHEQIGEAVEDARKKGVPTEFTPGGRPIFTDRGHRAAYCKAYGYFDKSGGYGDASPGDFRGDRPDKPSVKELFGEDF